jgi:hypothetical protein
VGVVAAAVPGLLFLLLIQLGALGFDHVGYPSHVLRLVFGLTLAWVAIGFSSSFVRDRTLAHIGVDVRNRMLASGRPESVRRRRITALTDGGLGGNSPFVGKCTNAETHPPSPFQPSKCTDAVRRQGQPGEIRLR